jgi:phosphopantothenoylcysteine synthetase/decarboxylase
MVSDGSEPGATVMTLRPGVFVVVLVSGSIAASNAPGLVSILKERLGQPVVAVVTRAARTFVATITLRYAGGAGVVLTDESEQLWEEPDHIWLSTRMSGLLVYPASANFIGRITAGLASDLASLTFLAAHRKKRMIVPSMNATMWSNPIVQKNIAALERDQVGIVKPNNGLAPAVEDVVDAFCGFLRTPES